MKIGEWLSSMKPLDEDIQYDFNQIAAYLTQTEKERLEQLLKTKQVKCKDEKFPVDACLAETKYPVLKPGAVDDETKAFIENINNKVRFGVQKAQLQEFSRYSQFIEQNLCPEIKGLDDVKRTLVLQLLCRRFHILLLGEHAEQLAKATAAIAPKAIVGNASGLQPDKDISILAKADKGLCVVILDGLQPGGRTALYSAMEHGHVRHDYGIRHEQLPADTNVLAVYAKRAKQPFDKAFMARFHLVLDTTAKTEKAKTLSTNDLQFIKTYLSLGQSIKPRLSPEIEERLGDAIAAALAVAAAKLELRDEVLRRDAEQAKILLEVHHGHT